MYVDLLEHSGIDISRISQWDPQSINMFLCFQSNLNLGSQNVAPSPAAPAASGSLLGMKILRPYPWPTNAGAEDPILWPPDAKNWLIGKDPDAGKDWRQEKGMTEDEMFGWHHRHEFEQALGDGKGQGSLECCGPLGCKGSDTTEWLNWTEILSNCFPKFPWEWGCQPILKCLHLALSETRWKNWASKCLRLLWESGFYSGCN